MNGSGASEDYVIFIVAVIVIYLWVAINAVHEGKIDWEESIGQDEGLGPSLEEL